jgi:UDP-N-acetylglucosamine:LPS N-acetylglucosamine transferase
MEDHNTQTHKTKNCFYICGLTGGPFFPIPAIMDQVTTRVQSTQSILIGVRNSYESNLSKELNYKIEYLPKAKLDVLSFRRLGVLEFLQGLLKSIISVFVLCFSFLKCIYLLLKYQPILIYSTGSFLAVPMLWAAKCTNTLKLTNAKLVVHQQDATVGLANRLTANFADLTSCVFQYTKDKYLQFQNAELISNPIIASKYNVNNNWQDKPLEKFVKGKTTDKPLLLIFGGGSGALAINNWVNNNISQLVANFRVIHLTGILQKENPQNSKAEVDNSHLEGKGTARFPCDVLSEGWQPQVDGVDKSDSNIFKNKIKQNPSYYTQPSVLQDMPTLLATVNLVICRAGLGSISELSLLNKPAFLVPLPNSHQEQNAQLVSQTNPNFKILDQTNQDSWLDMIQNTKFEQETKNFDQPLLDKYYEQLIKLLI